jgi:hypothetical protein
MRLSYPAGLAVLALTAALALAPSAARAACGDLNNNGSVNIADVQILGQCVSNCVLNPPCDVADCPAVAPGPLCGTGTLAGCADIFKENPGPGTDTVAKLTADLIALNTFVAGGEPLYTICNGPGNAIPCPGGNATIGSLAMSTTINSSQTWPAGCTVTIAGTIFVDTPPASPTTVLRVEPGVVVKGQTGSTTMNPTALIFLANNTDPNPANFRKAKIDAAGTPSAPIVFTSSAVPPNRNRGDWGGVVFNGLADVNGPGCKFQSEGIPTAFGGCKSTDSSGIATFVRVEYAGIGFSANNELNVFTMNGLGSQTQFNFIQANDGLDDCHEWFGGTLHQNHLLASACGDDAFDWQLGYTGSVQYGLYVQNGAETDPNSDSRGIEGDNSEFGLDNTPRSNPDMCNLTLIGGRNQAGANAGSDSGVLLRRGTHGQMANMIVTSFADNGTELRDNNTSRQACVDANADRIPESLTGNLIIRNSIFYDNGGGAVGSMGYLAPGTATEHPLNRSNAMDNLDQNGTACDTAACVDEALEFDDTAPCACDTETWYALLVSGFNVANACGSNATNPNVNDGDQYPGPDATENGACTGLQTPSLCCTGAGTGTCLELFDARATPSGGTVPPAFDCKNLNPIFDTTTYLGAFNPAASCTTAGATAACDWVRKPWASFSID